MTDSERLTKLVGDTGRELGAAYREIARLKEVAHAFVDEIGERDKTIARALVIAREMREQLINGPESWDVDRIIEALSGSARTAPKTP